MSSSNVTVSPSIQNEINTINSFIILWARWGLLIILIIGIICNILNIYVFTRPALKRNTSCMYFLASSVTSLIYIVTNIPLRTLQMGYSIDPTAYVLAVCKIKFFVTYTYRGLTIWFLVLASFDRFLQSSSNANRREWSSFKVATRVIPLTLVLAHLVHIHVPIYYEILLPRRSCSIANDLYAVFLGIWHLLTYGLGPPLLMLIFSLLTVRHIRHRRINPVINPSNQANKNSNKERNLNRMALAQCLIVGLTTTAYAAGQLYTTSTANQVKSSLQLARDNLLGNLVGSISGLGHCTTFFVFTITSKLFRQQLSRRRDQTRNQTLNQTHNQTM